MERDQLEEDSYYSIINIYRGREGDRERRKAVKMGDLHTYLSRVEMKLVGIIYLLHIILRGDIYVGER